MTIFNYVYDLLRILFISVIIAVIYSIFTLFSVYAGPPIRNSGNIAANTRFTDASGRSLGTKRTYDYGHTVRSYYYDRSGKYIGNEVQQRSMLKQK